MRDLSYEKYSFYRRTMNKIKENSVATFISSDGFRQFFIDQEGLYTFHNIQKENELPLCNNHKNGDQINISFWGLLRDYELNVQLIERLKNRNRFCINFYGLLSEKMFLLQKYCLGHNIKNVHFYGEYKQEERFSFAKNTFFVNNLFENGAGSNPIMSNKFYDALLMGLPQICLKGSYMGEIVNKGRLGLSVEIDDHLPNILEEYYESADLRELRLKCNELVKKYLDDNERALTVVRESLAHKTDCFRI